MAARRALITGIGGQDGSLLAELLLGEGYEVFGVVRRAPGSYENLAAIRDRNSRRLYSKKASSLSPICTQAWSSKVS